MQVHYRHSYPRTCRNCETDYEAHNKSSKYCTPACRTEYHIRHRQKGPKGAWMREPITCACGAVFYRTVKHGPNQKYCSPDCSFKARGLDFQRFKERNQNAQQDYNTTRTKKQGSDTLFNRVMRKYPELPRACQARGCGESRVLELAHRPEFKRNGAWRTIDKYAPHMIWILCPTCHRVLDLGVETPEVLGLC